MGTFWSFNDLAPTSMVSVTPSKSQWAIGYALGLLEIFVNYASQAKGNQAESVIIMIINNNNT